MTLQNLQADFVEAILANQPLDNVKSSANLCIYQNNIHSQLTDALRNTYPLIAKLVGDDFFGMMSNAYIGGYPSRSGNLHDYGEYFTNFLVEYEPARHLSYLPEVAQFEWACRSVFYAADHASLDKSILERVSPERYGELHFVLHPASQLLRCHYPMLRIIDLCKGHMEDNIDLQEGGVNLLIIRRELNISLVSLEASDFAFLQALRDNLSLEDALNAARQLDTQFKLDEKLPKWIQDRTIVDCH